LPLVNVERDETGCYTKVMNILAENAVT